MMNKLLETIIQDRFQISAVKMEHLRSSAYYEQALDYASRAYWGLLEELLRRIQVIPTRTDMRHTKKN